MPQTVLEIDLKALIHNFEYLKSKLNPEVKILAVVKAFGYGSDAAVVAKKLEDKNVDYFAVAYTEEGIALRNAGIKTPVLVLHPQPESFNEIIKYCLEPSLYSFRVLNAFIEAAQGLKKYPVHLKFNTGLNRLGFKEGNEEEILSSILDKDEIYIKSLFSHLVASEDLNEKEFTKEQITSFKNTADKIIAGLDYKPLLHQSNTSAIINYPEAQFDMVRTGIGLYGYGNTPEEDAKLKPVATLKSVISQIHEISEGETVGYNRAYTASKPERTATIPIGHADGVSRAYGNGKGYIIVNGKKAPIVGNVCMDMIMVNVTDIKCAEGDEVIVFGKNNSAVTLSKQINSIAYELLTAISQRVKRRYKE